MRKITRITLLSLTMLLAGCSTGMNNAGIYYGGNEYNQTINSEEYQEINERGFVDASIEPLSSFSLNSSSYAYTNIRRLINNNENISKDAVVIEEMLNYFNYSYTNETDEALSTTMELGECPWNEEHHLALISVNSKEIEMKDTKNNFVFLIDTSGSMSSINKLGLFQESFRLFADSINENDTISIVTYANGVRVVADGIKGDNKNELVSAVDSLVANGGTNGSGGIQTAYNIAQKHFIDNGNNRILLATDGDFNIGIRNQNELNDFISSKRETGVYLSVFGYGMGNTKHNTMETLAENGNGNAYYIDSILEAKKIFVNELGSVLNTVAKDSKIQIEFNPETINKYRLLGYENSMLTNEQFEDENQDAGEIGAGHTTIAMYEIELKDNPNENFYFKSKLRYIDTNDNLNKEVVNDINHISLVSNDFNFAASVVEFALILRDSSFKGNSSYDHLLSKLENVELDDEYKQEFKELVIKAKNNQEINY